jgi:hypothetical protein
MRREDAMQKAVASLLDASGLTWNHSPNEGLRTPRQGAHAKSMGLKPGFPDVAIFDGFDIVTEDAVSWCSAWHYGLAIELKSPDAKGKRPKPTANQLKWHADLRRCGWRVEVCYSIDEVLDVLKECYPYKFK